MRSGGEKKRISGEGTARAAGVAVAGATAGDRIGLLEPGIASFPSYAPNQRRRTRLLLRRGPKAGPLGHTGCPHRRRAVPKTACPPPAASEWARETIHV